MKDEIKYDAKTDMWYINSPIGVRMYFRYRDEAVRVLDNIMGEKNGER